jgi:hypothetical protein
MGNLRVHRGTQFSFCASGSMGIRYCNLLTFNANDRSLVSSNIVRSSRDQSSAYVAESMSLSRHSIIFLIFSFIRYNNSNR